MQQNGLYYIVLYLIIIIGSYNVRAGGFGANLNDF